MAGLVEMAGAGRWTREGGRWVSLGPAPAIRPRDPRHRQEVRTKAKTDIIKGHVLRGLHWLSIGLCHDVSVRVGSGNDGGRADGRLTSSWCRCGATTPTAPLFRSCDTSPQSFPRLQSCTASEGRPRAGTSPASNLPRTAGPADRCSGLRSRRHPGVPS